MDFRRTDLSGCIGRHANTRDSYFIQQRQPRATGPLLSCTGTDLSLEALSLPEEGLYEPTGKHAAILEQRPRHEGRPRTLGERSLSSRSAAPDALCNTVVSGRYIEPEKGVEWGLGIDSSKTWSHNVKIALDAVNDSPEQSDKPCAQAQRTNQLTPSTVVQAPTGASTLEEGTRKMLEGDMNGKIRPRSSQSRERKPRHQSAPSRDGESPLRSFIPRNNTKTISPDLESSTGFSLCPHRYRSASLVADESHHGADIPWSQQTSLEKTPPSSGEQTYHTTHLVSPGKLPRPPQPSISQSAPIKPTGTARAMAAMFEGASAEIVALPTSLQEVDSHSQLKTNDMLSKYTINPLPTISAPKPQSSSQLGSTSSTRHPWLRAIRSCSSLNSGDAIRKCLGTSTENPILEAERPVGGACSERSSTGYTIAASSLIEEPATQIEMQKTASSSGSSTASCLPLRRGTARWETEPTDQVSPTIKILQQQTTTHSRSQNHHGTSISQPAILRPGQPHSVSLARRLSPSSMPGTLPSLRPPPPPSPPFLSEPSSPPRSHPATVLAPHYQRNRRSPATAAALARKIIHALSAERHRLRHQLKWKTNEVARLRHELGETRRRADAYIGRLGEKIYEMERERLTWQGRAETVEEDNQGRMLPWDFPEGENYI